MYNNRLRRGVGGIALPTSSMLRYSQARFRGSTRPLSDSGQACGDDVDDKLGAQDDCHIKPSQTQDGEDISNMPVQVEPRSWGFYVVLLGFVTPVFLITPLSVSYVAWSTYRWLPMYMKPSSANNLETDRRWWEAVLLLYAGLETLFAIYYQIVAAKVRKHKSHTKPRDIHQLQLIFTRLLQSNLAPPQSPGEPARPASPAELIVALKEDDPRAIEFRHHLRTWFWYNPWKNITRKSMRIWLAWSIFDKHFETLGSVEAMVVDEALLLLEKRCGGRLADKRPNQGEDIMPMKLTLDPINIWSRPGIAYVVPRVANFLAHSWYTYRFGLTYGSFNGIEYLIRLPNDRATAKQPVVFLHGIGIGLAQYLLSLNRILAHIPESQPILIPLQRHISQTIFHPNYLEPIDREVWTDGLRDLFLSLGWSDGVAMISHSKGSLTHAWLLKAYPDLIQRSCFIDPVVFCLWEGDLAMNFVYKKPKTALSLFIKYFVGTEPGVANAIYRHFDWSANSLWFEEIPRARDPYYASFFLGGKDNIIDANRAQLYLARHGVGEGLHFDPLGHHGQAIMHPGEGKGLDMIGAWLRMSPSMEEEDEVVSSGSEEQVVNLLGKQGTFEERIK